jgi:hypothetical protein
MPVNPNTFKRAQRGLYGGKIRATGYNISPSKRQCVPEARRWRGIRAARL